MPDNMGNDTLQPSVKTQAEIATFQREVEHVLARMDERLGRIEDIMREQSRDFADTLAMMGPRPDDFDESVSEILECMDAFDGASA